MFDRLDAAQISSWNVGNELFGRANTRFEAVYDSKSLAAVEDWRGFFVALVASTEDLRMPLRMPLRVPQSSSGQVLCGFIYRGRGKEFWLHACLGTQMVSCLETVKQELIEFWSGARREWLADDNSSCKLDQVDNAGRETEMQTKRERELQYPIETRKQCRWGQMSYIGKDIPYATLLVSRDLVELCIEL